MFLYEDCAAVEGGGIKLLTNRIFFVTIGIPFPGKLRLESLGTASHS